MTNTLTPRPEVRGAIVGVDTHKHIHVAVAIDTCGIHLGDQSFAADSGGSQALLTGAETHGADPGVRHRRHRRLWRGPCACGPPSGASCCGSESSGPAPAPRRRQVRPDRRRGRRPIGAGGPSDRDAKDRRMVPSR